MRQHTIPSLLHIAVVVSIATINLAICDSKAVGQQSGLTNTTPAIDDRTAADSVDKDYSTELPRIPATSAEAALESLQVLPGFSVQLVVAEPLISDPIAFAFDGRGRMFVVEMLDYSEQADDHLGRVAMLVDRDEDGVYDQRTTFVEGLSWPTAIWPWRDGVLVAEPPRITWYRDTDNDGQSDVVEDWFTGFARSNVQGLVNSLRWGIDGRIHGATSSSGAAIESLATTGARIELGRRDFAIDPLNKTLHPETGGGQHGLGFNRWGDKFVTSNSDHLQQIVDLEAWLEEHPSRVPMPGLRRSIAVDGPQAEVFRASPVEPWRVVRTRLRVSGVVPGIVEGGGRASGYFTGATGTCILDADLGFGLGGYDTALVCDVGSNLVHRKQLNDGGIFWTARRIDTETELLRSKDVWFRPVQLADGPDGAVYIADMAREVIEHPASLPPMIKRHLDLTSGRELGRIWRLAPIEADSTRSQHRISENVAALSTDALIERLGDSIPWQRLMASQLLIERGAEQVSQAALLRFMRDSNSAVGQILAMHVAARLDLADAALLRVGLNSSEVRVVEQAVHVARQQGLVQPLLADLIALTEPTAEQGNDHVGVVQLSPRLQLALAMAAADVQPPADADLLLSRLLPAASEPLVRTAIAIAAGDRSWHLVRDELFTAHENRGADESNDAAAEIDRLSAEWLAMLLPVWVQQVVRENNEPLLQWIAGELQSESERLPLWLDALSQLNNIADARLLWERIAPEQQVALQAWIQARLVDGVDDSDDRATLAWVMWLNGEAQLQWLERALVPSMSEQRQAEMLQALTRFPSRPLFAYVIEHLRELTPRVQGHALRAICSVGAAREQLLVALETDVLPASLVTVDIRQTLLGSQEAEQVKRFQRIFAATSEDRAAVVARYRQSLPQGVGAASSLETGEQVFRRACAQCHQIGDIGIQVGPPLQQLREKSVEQLLEAILDPNREVDPKYVGYGVMMNDDRLLSGIIRDESAAQIVLQEAGGVSHTILREDIDQLKSSGLSLMPVGLEEQVSPEQMQALLEFLKR